MTKRDIRGYELALQARAFEEAQRPFAERPPQWKIGRPDQPQDDTTPILTWTAQTDVQIFEAPSLGFQTKDDEQEVDRVTREERVENPEDSNQYVDVEIIEEITFRFPNGQTRTVTFNNDNEP